MQVKKQQLEPDMEQQTGSNLRKEYDKVVYCHPANLTYTQSIWCRMPGWMNHRLESRLLGKISATSNTQMIPSNGRSEEELKSLLMKVKEESEKADSKLSIQQTKIMTSIPIISRQIEREKVEAVTDFIFLSSKITEDGDCSHEIKRCLPLGIKARQCIKKQRHHFADKGLFSQSYGFSSTHVLMWELDHKESWAPKNWCFWTVLENGSPLNCKEIKPVNLKGNQPWIFIARTDAEAPILWPPDAKRSQLTGKDPDARKDWTQKKKGVGEDVMVK